MRHYVRIVHFCNSMLLYYVYSPLCLVRVIPILQTDVKTLAQLKARNTD